MKRAFPIWFLFLVALVAPAAAQSLDLTRARVTGGGGVSAGGQFTLFSTVAQPESAARVTGGAFTLDSGFLGVTLPSPIPTVYFPSGTVTVPEDAGAQTRLTYATFEPGDAGPPAQPATFQLSNNNPALFSVAPAMDSSRTLTFTAVANASGTATVTVVVRADGVAVATNTFAIVVTPVNDQPSVTLAGNQTVLEDAGAQSVSSFATFTAGPADESAQTPTHTLTADNPALFGVQPAIAANGTLTYTPAPNANGSATVTVVTSDGGGTANGGVDRTTNTFTITVAAVNDAPSVTLAQSTVTVLEDAGAQSLVGFATFSAGPANESAQTLVGYTVSHNNSALFSSAPALAVNGTLTFTPAANANGSATVTVIVQDNGGTTDGGVDRTTNTFTITVTAVNDAPSLAFSANPVALALDSGPQNIPGFVTFLPGPPDEAAQTPAYTVTTDNAALFSAAPAIAANGTLTFTTATGIGGAATVTVVVQDTGGIANGGVDKATNTFTISVLAFAGVADSYTVAEDATLTRAAAAGVLANDIGPALRAVLVATTTNGALALNLDGSFTYQPATNFFGTDHFTYLATNSADISAVTVVTLTVTSVNDAPTVTLAQTTVTVLEDAGAQTFNAFATFSPGPANESAQTLLGYTVSNSSNALFSVQPTISGAGVLTFTPATNANGSATVTVIAQDSGGTTGGGVDKTTNTFTITVTPVNDAPSVTLSAGVGGGAAVRAWGNNIFGQTNVPVGLRGVVAIAVGYYHCLALKSDGTVVAWGRPDEGQTVVPVGLSGVTAIAAGGFSSLALKSDGTVVAWGHNGSGQVNVPGNLSGVRAIAMGSDHALAAKGDGTVVAWGSAQYGQTSVPGGLSEVTAVAAGNTFSLALKSDETVVAWGTSFSGETDIPAGLRGVRAIAAGSQHALALKSDGTVVAWGANGSGQSTVPAGLGGVVAVAAGNSHSLALKSDGTVVAWGSNFLGESDVPADLSGVTAIAAGHTHSLALYIPPTVLTLLEDAGPQTRSGFVTSFSPGPANESAQIPTHQVSNNNPSLFSAAPAIAADGTLTFTPAANANGTASIVVITSDGGGTGNGGVDRTTNSFTITVTPVNDAPSVTLAQGTVTVLEDAGAQARAVFAIFSPGPANEAAQALVGYTVTVNNASLFSAAPAINNAGALTFTPATNANGSATVTVIAQDNGGTADGGVDKSTNTFTIVVTAVNDTPVANPDSYTMNQGDVLTVAGLAPLALGGAGVLANDTDVENSPLTAVLLAHPMYGPVTLNANGGFTYTPDANFHGVDIFAYRAFDGEAMSVPAPVSITVLARPVITSPPGQQRVFSSAALRFSATNAPDINAIRVADPDSTTLTLTLTVTNGTLGIAVTNGLAFPNGFTNTNSLVLAGPIAELNAALESLAYLSTTNYFGDDTLTLLAVDEGGRTNRGGGVLAILVEVPARGAALDVPLAGLNTPGGGRSITNATAVAMDTNLVEGITFDRTNLVVNVLPTAGQDGSTNRSTVTVLAQFNDGTTQLVTVPVIIYRPLLTATTNLGTYNSTFGAPLFNPQTSLYEQKVSVQNNTPFDFTALRITATNLPATVTLQNATLTNGARPYIDHNLAIRSGSNVTLKLEYFSSDLQPFTPGLKLELLNQTRTTTAPTNAVMTAISPRSGYAPDGLVKNYVQFPTRAGQPYYVQYQDAAGPVWKTSPVVITGTGFPVNWMDDGPPNTETAPGPARFYRVVTDR